MKFWPPPSMPSMRCERDASLHQALHELDLARRENARLRAQLDEQPTIGEAVREAHWRERCLALMAEVEDLRTILGHGAVA